MADLDELRRELDGIDDELVRLFVRRMETIKTIAAVKAVDGLAIKNEARERQILDRVKSEAGELGIYAEKLFCCILEQSREYQKEIRQKD